MSGRGFYACQDGHVVNILPPVDINSGVNSDVFSMENYSHATIIIQAGVTGAASTVTVKYSATSAGSGTAMAFRYAAETTDAGDTLGALTAVASTGFATSTNNNIMYVIEIDADELADGYPWLQVCFSNPSASTIASAVAILSGARYAKDANATAIA